MALTESEQRKRVATMRAAGSVGGGDGPSPQQRFRTVDPSVTLKGTPPSRVPSIRGMGGAVTGLAATGVSAAVGAASAGPLGAIAGALVGLIGGALTEQEAQRQQEKEGVRAQQIAMENQKALAGASLETQRSAQRAEIAQQMATPRQEMMEPPRRRAAPGAASRIAGTLLGG